MSIAAQPTAFIDVSVNTSFTTVVTASHVNLLFFTVPIVRSGWANTKGLALFLLLAKFFLYVLCSESLNIIKRLGPTGHLLCKNYEGEKSGHLFWPFQSHWVKRRNLVVPRKPFSPGAALIIILAVYTTTCCIFKPTYSIRALPVPRGH